MVLDSVIDVTGLLTVCLSVQSYLLTHDNEPDTRLRPSFLFLAIVIVKAILNILPSMVFFQNENRFSKRRHEFVAWSIEAPFS